MKNTSDKIFWKLFVKFWKLQYVIGNSFVMTLEDPRTVGPCSHLRSNHDIWRYIIYLRTRLRGGSLKVFGIIILWCTEFCSGRSKNMILSNWRHKPSHRKTSGHKVLFYNRENTFLKLWDLFFLILIGFCSWTTSPSAWFSNMYLHMPSMVSVIHSGRDQCFQKGLATFKLLE